MNKRDERTLLAMEAIDSYLKDVFAEDSELDKYFKKHYAVDQP